MHSSPLPLGEHPPSPRGKGENCCDSEAYERTPVVAAILPPPHGGRGQGGGAHFAGDAWAVSS